MKKSIFILSFYFVVFCAFGQTDTGRATAAADSLKDTTQPAIAKKAKQQITNTVKRRVAADTLKRADTLLKADSATTDFARNAAASSADTIKKKAAPAVIKRPVDSIYLKLLNNPFTRTNVKPIYFVINERERQAKDELFYLFSGLLLFLAFIKLLFSRYFKNVFRLFFQPSFRQKHTREQLLQNNLPSLLLNLFFVFSAAAYVTFLMHYYNLSKISFWQLLLYTSVILLVLYIGKFLFLSFAGWVFNVKEATNAFMFAVYLINKILGVILIPFTILIAFSLPAVINVSVTISALIVSLLFIYRYIISFTTVRREVKTGFFHFLLYVFAFEIIPLLLIYKTLIIYLNKSL